MAIVNFSVPDEIKKRFNKVFAEQNKSHIIAELMQQAIEQHEGQMRRVQAIEELLKLRAKQKPISDKVIKAARHKGRP